MFDVCRVLAFVGRRAPLATRVLHAKLPVSDADHLLRKLRVDPSIKPTAHIFSPVHCPGLSRYLALSTAPKRIVFKRVPIEIDYICRQPLGYGLVTLSKRKPLKELCKRDLANTR